MARITWSPFSSSTSAPEMVTPSYFRNRTGSSPEEIKHSFVKTEGISLHSPRAALHWRSMRLDWELSIQSAPSAGLSGAVSDTAGLAYSVPSSRQRLYSTPPAEL